LIKFFQVFGGGQQETGTLFPLFQIEMLDNVLVIFFYKIFENIFYKTVGGTNEVRRECVLE
jgi:hypothetical protein